MNDEQPTHLDLFSGIGGFAIAAAWAGFRTIGFSEIDPYACKILKQHWPDVPNFGDIRNVRGIQADLVTAGVPCQPASWAGKRGGRNDDRWLWPEAFAVIRSVHPTQVLLENVPGILALEQGMAFEHLCLELESFGYEVQPIIIPAIAVDARHRRDRVWLVGNAYGSGCWDDSPLQAGRWQQGQRQRDNPTATSPSRWHPEPDVGRVAHGVPNRSHRLKALGNAIVPAAAYQILKVMYKLHMETLCVTVEHES